jgi:hypothetical protein
VAAAVAAADDDDGKGAVDVVVGTFLVDRFCCFERKMEDMRCKVDENVEDERDGSGRGECDDGNNKEFAESGGVGGRDTGDRGAGDSI